MIYKSNGYNSLTILNLLFFVYVAKKINMQYAFKFVILKPVKIYQNEHNLKAVRIEFFFILKVDNIRCFILIAVEIFHNIIHK